MRTVGTACHFTPVRSWCPTAVRVVALRASGGGPGWCPVPARVGAQGPAWPFPGAAAASKRSVGLRYFSAQPAFPRSPWARVSRRACSHGGPPVRFLAGPAGLSAVPKWRCHVAVPRVRSVGSGRSSCPPFARTWQGRLCSPSTSRLPGSVTGGCSHPSRWSRWGPPVACRQSASSFRGRPSPLAGLPSTCAEPPEGGGGGLGIGLPDGPDCEAGGRLVPTSRGLRSRPAPLLSLGRAGLAARRAGRRPWRPVCGRTMTTLVARGRQSPRGPFPPRRPQVSWARPCYPSARGSGLQTRSPADAARGAPGRCVRGVVATSAGGRSGVQHRPPDERRRSGRHPLGSLAGAV